MSGGLEVGIVCTGGPVEGRPEVNQDNYLVCRNGKARFRKGGEEAVREAVDQGVLMAVSDGIGQGHDGALAATTVVQCLPHLLSASSPPGATEEEHLRLFLLSAHRRIRDAAKTAGPVRMGAAVSVIWCLNQTMFWAHIGDTRLYHMRYRQLHQLSRDHSLDELASRQGGVGHPAGKSLAQTLVGGTHGPATGSEIQIDAGLDTGAVPLLGGDQILLCTDGIWKQTNEALISQVLRTEPTPQRAAEALVKAAQDRGATDSATALVVRIS